MSNVMTQAEYVHLKGAQCPHCRSTDVACDKPLSGDPEQASASMSCGNCSATWEEQYKVSGYTKITLPY